jgi:hypothetical protein
LLGPNKQVEGSAFFCSCPRRQAAEASDQAGQTPVRARADSLPSTHAQTRVKNFSAPSSRHLEDIFSEIVALCPIADGVLNGKIGSQSYKQNRKGKRYGIEPE